MNKQPAGLSAVEDMYSGKASNEEVPWMLILNPYQFWVSSNPATKIFLAWCDLYSLSFQKVVILCSFLSIFPI